jgi:hypothetical protein
LRFHIIYYEHAQFICNNRILGRQDVVVPDYIKNELIQRFERIVIAHTDAYRGRPNVSMSIVFILTRLLNTMMPFQDDAQLLSQLSLGRIKSNIVNERMERAWEETVIRMMRPRTPPCSPSRLTRLI